MSDLTPKGIATAYFPIKRKTNVLNHQRFIEAKLCEMRLGTHHRLLTVKHYKSC